MIRCAFARASQLKDEEQASSKGTTVDHAGPSIGVCPCLGVHLLMGCRQAPTSVPSSEIQADDHSRRVFVPSRSAPPNAGR